jgi:hypothetical protein
VRNGGQPIDHHVRQRQKVQQNIAHRDVLTSRCSENRAAEIRQLVAVIGEFVAMNTAYRRRRSTGAAYGNAWVACRRSTRVGRVRIRRAWPVSSSKPTFYWQRGSATPFENAVRVTDFDRRARERQYHSRDRRAAGGRTSAAPLRRHRGAMRRRAVPADRRRGSTFAARISPAIDRCAPTPRFFLWVPPRPRGTLGRAGK